MIDTSPVTSKLDSELELLERHIRVLKITKENQPIGIIRLAELLDMRKQEHKVRYSLRILEGAGLIEATSGGAKVTEEYDNFMEHVSEYLDELTERLRSVKESVPLT